MGNPGNRKGLITTVREITVLVLSILIAFGLDAWWGGVVEKHALRDSLKGVVSDLIETRIRLDEDVAVRRSMATSLTTLLALTGPQAVVPDDQEVGYLIEQINRSATLAPVTGAINSLVQSGAIRSIDDDSLRVALAAWDENVRDYTEDEVFEADEAFMIIRPYLAGRVRLWDLGVDGSGGEFEPDYSALLRDLTFANVVAMRLRRVRQILTEADALRLYIDRTIRLIETEIGG